MCMYTHSYVSSCKCIPLKIYADSGRGYKYFFKGTYIVCTRLFVHAYVRHIYIYVYHTQVRTYIYKISEYIHSHHIPNTYTILFFSFVEKENRRNVVAAVVGVMLVARIFFSSIVVEIRFRLFINVIRSIWIDNICINRD